MSEEITVDAKMEEVVSYIENLTLLQASKLVKVLEERLGVSAAAPVAVAAAAGPAAAAAPAEEEKTEFDVILADAGAQKLGIVKLVKEITGLSLKEAKELVDGAPKPIKTAVSKDEANDIKKKLEEGGAKVEVK